MILEEIDLWLHGLMAPDVGEVQFSVNARTYGFFVTSVTNIHG